MLVATIGQAARAGSAERAPTMKRVSVFCAAACTWFAGMAACVEPLKEPLRLGYGDSSVQAKVTFSRDGKWLAAVARYGELLVWDMATKKELARRLLNEAAWAKTQSTALYLAFSPDSARLGTGTSHAILLWDGRQGWDRATRVALVSPTAESDNRKRKRVGSHWTLDGLFAFSPDGKTVAYGCSPTVRIVRVRTGEEIGVLPLGGAPDSLSFIQGGRTLVIGVAMPPQRQGGAEVQFWDMESFKPKTKPFRTGRHGAIVATTSRDEKLVAIVRGGPVLVGGPGEPADVGLYDIETGTCVILASDPSFGANTAFSPDGHTLAVTVLTSPKVLLWDLATRTIERTLKAPSGSGVWNVAFSPDGKCLAAGLVNSPEPVCLWELPSRPSKRQLPDTPSENQPRGRPL